MFTPVHGTGSRLLAVYTKWIIENNHLQFVTFQRTPFSQTHSSIVTTFNCASFNFHNEEWFYPLAVTYIGLVLTFKFSLYEISNKYWKFWQRLKLEGHQAIHTEIETDQQTTISDVRFLQWIFTSTKHNILTPVHTSPHTAIRAALVVVLTMTITNAFFNIAASSSNRINTRTKSILYHCKILNTSWW